MGLLHAPRAVSDLQPQGCYSCNQLAEAWATGSAASSLSLLPSSWSVREEHGRRVTIRNRDRACLVSLRIMPLQSAPALC